MKTLFDKFMFQAWNCVLTAVALIAVHLLSVDTVWALLPLTVASGAALVRRDFPQALLLAFLGYAIVFIDFFEQDLIAGANGLNTVGLISLVAAFAYKSGAESQSSTQK